MAWLRALAGETGDVTGLGASGVARLAAVLAVAAAIGLAGQSPAGAAGPDVGRPCRSMYRAPVTLTAQPGGGTEAVFTLAGGTLHGAVPLTEPDARALRAHRDVHVTDVRLGSFEPAGDGAVACRLDATYHFYCQATDTLDQLCLEWAGGSWPW